MKSVMDHSFSTNPEVDVQRSSFDRSHGHKTTFNAGELVPIFHDEVLPGDTFNLKMSAFGRMATPIYPIMDNQYLDVHFFFVPIRQLWDNWRMFMGERVDPDDDPTSLLVPQVNITAGASIGTFEDYIGIPTGVAGLSYCSFYWRAYQHIWNEWYRDQNLQDSYAINRGDSDNTHTSGVSLKKRGKRHDYFTSCLPWPQKGDAVTLPLGEFANVSFQGPDNSDVGVYSTIAGGSRGLDSNGTSNTVILNTANTPTHQLYADLSTATAATINELRQAFQVQKLLERDARSGTRYPELVETHFGVEFNDLTYRPEFLGGGSTVINQNPVAQTSSTDATTPQGNLSSFGTVGFNDIGFTKSFNEHGIVMGIASVRTDLTYQQGLDRAFSRQTRYDYYWPSLAHLGEQAVLNKEIYADGNPVNDDGVFGYQERYGEYRYKKSLITGKMRSSAASSLDAWHLSEEFGSLPALGDSFIQENPPMSRVLATPSEPHIILDTYFSMRCARPMPLFGIPGFIDHF